MINIKYARKNYMKIDQIINEMTSSGAVASVSMRLGATQKRAKESVEVKGLKPVSKLKNAKKKGPYANSIVENKEQVKVSEAELQEDDLIVIPGRGTKRKNGFVPKGQSRVDHEVEMARSDVLATMKNAKSIYHMLKNRSEEEGIEGWVQEKLIKANDYLNAVKEYYDEQMMQEMNGGVIAAGGVGEGVAEGIFSNIFNKKPNQQTHSGPAISQFDSVDPYTILGISRGANTEEIKNAYRKLATVYHPDKPTGDQQKFQKINMAYRSLMGRLEETFLPEDILNEAAPWVDKLGLGNWFRKIKDKDATNQQGIRILSGVNHAAQLYFKTILALNASVSPALSLFWPILGKQALLFLGGAVVYTIGKILATKIGRALFGSTEEALAFAKAHLKAGEEKKTSFIFDGKTYPVTVIDYDTISKLKYQIFELENLISSRKGRADYADYLKTQKEQEKTKQLTRQQGVAEGLAPGQAAWKKEMMAKGAVSFKRDQHGGGAVDRIVAYDKDGKVVGGFNRKGVAEGSSDKVHLKTPKHGLADHPGRNTGVGLSTFAATSEQDRCPKCNSLYKNHYQKQGVAASKDKSDKKS